MRTSSSVRSQDVIATQSDNPKTNGGRVVIRTHANVRIAPEMNHYRILIDEFTFRTLWIFIKTTHSVKGLMVLQNNSVSRIPLDKEVYQFNNIYANASVVFRLT
jgi:hypothetical protein